jgi:hypothetical protein
LAGLDDFDTRNDVYLWHSGLENGDFVLGVDRFVDGGPDVFASDFTHQVDLLSGIETTATDEFAFGYALANYSNTLELTALDLYGASGRITDIATVTGTSGHQYSVAGFVGTVPEPSSLAMMLLGLALVALTARRLQRQ